MIFNDILLKDDGMIKGPFGSAVKKSLFVPKGDNTYKVYEQSVVSNNDYSKGNYYLPKDYVDGSLRRFMIQPGDILMTGAGTLGLLSIVPDSIEPGIMNQALIRVRLNEKVIYKPYFMYYFPWAIKKVATRINGDSVIPNLPPLDVLKKIEINIPSLDEQKLIADSLAIVDSKILNNGAICTELEAMARTLYDYWFVKFDFPDENGKPYKSSGGKMVWHEQLKREIPEGWEVKRLSEVIYPTERGISYSTPNIKTGEGVLMLNLATFMPGGGEYKADGLKHFLGDYPQNKVLKPYELIMCNTQQTAIKFETDIIGRAMLVPDIFDGDVVFSHHVNVIRTKDEDMRYYLLYLFNSDYYHKYISGFTNGTNILGLSFSGVEEYLTEVPSHELLKEFGTIVLNAEKKKSEILKENQQLTSLRDFLLPMLMNGQVKVN